MLALASKCAVLIVEDNKDTGEMLFKFLKRKGFSSEVVPDGMAALEFLEGGLPKCLIADVQMPRMDGLELLRQIKARPEYKHLPVIFYSANYDWRKQMEAEAIGAAGWYIKGITSLRELAKVVETYCVE
ncbi:MAG TPA: response regulator [Tepidisphaeraceae bacterium]|jgi:two-component system chemotaxis response regulator CheY